MYRNYWIAGLALSLVLAAGPGMKTEAAGIGSDLGASVAAGITETLSQEEVTIEEIKQVASETLWVGTPLEGYPNIAISNVEDNLNVRAEATTDSKIVGKMRNDSACNVDYWEGEWAHITSGEVEGFVKGEYLVTGQDAVEKALEMGHTVARVTADALYVRMQPDTEADYWTKVPKGEELSVMQDLGDWVKVDIDGQEGYVSAEYVEVSNELKTALTITEALYGEGVTDVRVSLCEFAKQYVGNRYVWGGTSLTKGADCSGFVLAVFRNYGISLPHSSRAQANYGTRISVSEAQPGDLIFYGNGRSINHVAICIGGGRIVHASNARTGIIISNMYYRSPVCATRIL